MASTQLFFFIAIVAILVPSILAKEFLVGDEMGWDTNYDYQGWTQGKEFHVGDQLVFRYQRGVHNVLKVDGTGFQQCVAPASTQPFTSGNDVITLTTPGEKWYICGFDGHCRGGDQKLAITVLAQTVSPSTPPTSAARKSIALIYYGWIMAIFGILIMVIV